jgi:curved DNA-binding protein CbpA
VTFAELEEARRGLGLPERATLSEIRLRHRELVKRHHPDRGGDGAELARVNQSWRVVQEYLAGYRFSFAEEEFYEQNPDERLRRQFMDDPVWGGG